MTATSAGSGSCVPAKGLDISLAALQRQDPYINNILDVASQVALYTYNNRTNEWEKTEVEGTLFIYTRLASPRHGFTIMNRLNMENLTEPITKDLDFQLQHPFLLYRNARLVIHGIWFYDKEDCQRIAQRMKILTQQEQAHAQSVSQGGWLSPGEGGSEEKTVDIIQMLSKARTEYDKSTSEPKEIGGSSVLCGNPNLIKPIPVKPNAQQDSEAAEPKPLSLATLFGSQRQHRHSSKSDPVSPLANTLEGSSTAKATRRPVARTLMYEDAVNSSRNATSKGESAATAGCSDRGLMAVIRGQTVGEDGKNGALGLVPGAAAAQQQQQQQNQPQHCPAIQKLMQGQRGVGGVVGVLQTLSESPENRLCDNGMLLEHHHHHHMLHQQQHHHYHHHHHQEQQLHPDPIKRLFQTQPLPPASAAPPCCSNPSPLQLCSQPIVVDTKPCSHLQAQQSQQLIFNPPKPQAETQCNSQSASATQRAGLKPSPVSNDQIPQPPQGQFSQVPSVLPPHELLLKLQLVQQEQNIAPHHPPHLCHGLAPRFLGPSQGLGAGPVPNLTAGQKGAPHFQVVSPQRIPASVAPNQLLSPSVFTQAKSGGGLAAAAKEGCPATRVLSKSQLQSTLLNLIQTDRSFLDTIYEAYVGRFAQSSSSKY